MSRPYAYVKYGDKPSEENEEARKKAIVEAIRGTNKVRGNVSKATSVVQSPAVSNVTSTVSGDLTCNHIEIAGGR